MIKNKIEELKRKLLIEIIKKIENDKCYISTEIYLVKGKAYSMQIKIKEYIKE